MKNFMFCIPMGYFISVKNGKVSLIKNLNKKIGISVYKIK